MLTDPQIWISFLTLTVLEIVLGIDNIIFISILAGKLPAHQQARARTIGLMLALVTRVLLLCSIFWLTKLTADLFAILGHGFSGKDLVMLLGGLFLLWKSVNEIHHLVDGHQSENSVKSAPSYASVLVQVMILDIVFSLDSVITAVGMADQLWVMVTAVIVSVIVMMMFSTKVAVFVEQNPTVKMLAVAFLVMIGAMLVADGCGTHVSKGYVYFAMLFALGVEVLNLRARTKIEEVTY